MSLVAGVDLGGTKIQSVMLDPAGDVRGAHFALTPQQDGPAGVLRAVAASVRAAAEDAGATPGDVRAVGLGSPGRIDPSDGTVSHAGNLPQWSGTVPVASVLREELGVPVELRNDVQAAVVAEAQRGAGRGHRSMLGVFCGTGVGGGIVIDGVLWRGRGAAGEIGHVIVRPNGAACPCGRRGCLEAYAGRAPMERAARRMAGRGRATTLFETMARLHRSHLTGEVWATALAEGDGLAAELLDRNVEAMGIALASAVNLLDVDAVIVGGGLAQALGTDYVVRVREAVQDRLVFPDRPPSIAPAGLGELAGAIGAALAAAESTDDRSRAATAPGEDRP